MWSRLGLGVALAMVCSAFLGGAALSSVSVAGGTAIQPQQAPWVVYVTQSPGANRIACSGVILDSLHILTAAHCVYDAVGNLLPTADIEVDAGLAGYLIPTGTGANAAQQTASVSSIRLHPSYTWASHGVPDDVAVLGLASPLDLSGPAAKPASLPSPNAPFPAGVTGVVAGYGLTAVGATPTYTLNELDITVDNLGRCGGYSILPVDDAVVLCAATPSGATCAGDSGAGLATTSGSPTVFALVSSATSCVLGSHSVFTYLGEPEILDFIKGSDNPPSAPRVTPGFQVTISETTPITVESTLTCASGPMTGRPTFTYAFENAKTGQVLKQGASATWIPGRAYLHDHIQCFVFAKNAGGTTALYSGVSPALGPATKKPGK